MSLSTRLAERGIVVNTPTNVLASEASRIAQETRTLHRNLRHAAGLDAAERDFLTFNCGMASDELQYVADVLAELPQAREEAA